MGQGDELMALGQAVAACREQAGPVAILDAIGNARWHPLWEGTPHVVPAREATTRVIWNGPGCRPYIDHVRSTLARWTFRPFAPTPAQLAWLRPDVRGAGAVVVEPNLKRGASPNKQWGWQRWQALVALAPQLDWVQLGPRGTRLLRGARLIETADFRAACNLLASARAAVLPEGGLHHAAAATGTPAVVLFGAYIQPTSTGYASHRNLAVLDPAAVGWRHLHDSCLRAWDQITPAIVRQHLTELLDG